MTECEARWRDPDGNLRSASGFPSRKAAEGYGSDREAGHRVWEFTRAQLIRAVDSKPVVRVLVMIEAEGGAPADLADAIIEALAEGAGEPDTSA